MAARPQQRAHQCDAADGGRRRRRPDPALSLGGMIFVEGMLWICRSSSLLTLPVAGRNDPSLEEAAGDSGADLRHTFQR